MKIRNMHITHEDKNDVETSKQIILQNYIDWINQRVFANAYALSQGIQFFAPEEFNNFNRLPTILKNNLSDYKQYHSRCLNFIIKHNYFPIPPDINFEDLYIAVRLMEDEIIELEFDNSSDYNESYSKYKPVLIARYNNHNFDNELKNILCSTQTVTNAFFRYVLHEKLEYNEFYEQKINNYIERQNTVEIVRSLEGIRISEPFYSKFSNDITTLINKSIQTSTMKISFDYILQIDSITKVLSDITPHTKDQLLNQLISQAKEKWVKGEMGDCIRDLWGILERIKTILDSNKPNGINKLVHNVSYSIYPNDAIALNNTKELFEAEFKLLTKIGNEYTIRHTETNKYNIHDKPELLKYFIKRISPLLELFLKAIPTE